MRPHLSLELDLAFPLQGLREQMEKSFEEAIRSEEALGPVSEYVRCMSYVVYLLCRQF